MAKKLSFVMLGAADVERAVGFYRDHLGCPCNRVPRGLHSSTRVR